MLRFLLSAVFYCTLLHVALAEGVPVNKKIIFSGLETMMSSIEKDLYNNKIFTIQGDEFVEITHSNEAPFMLIDSTNPYGFKDLMNDVKSEFTGNEVSNINKAKHALNKVKEAANFVQKFDGSSLVKLPVGMRKDTDSTSIAIVLNAIRIYPTYTALEVFVEVKRADWPLPLIFYAPDIKYSQASGLSGPSAVGLLGNMVIPFEENKAAVLLRRAKYDATKKIFTNGTYLQFNCDGFQELSVDASVLFSREWMVPLMPNGQIDTSGRVQADISTGIKDLDDMIFEVTIDEFVVPQSDRVAWQITKAVFDFSETRKAFDFPLQNLSYNPMDDGILPDMESWKGIKIDQFSVRWLDTIAENTKNNLPEIAGYDIVIDHNGFTGFVTADNLLTLDEGNVDGWDFSIEHLGLLVIKNQPSYFEFDGELVIPILEKDKEKEDSNITESLIYGGSFDFENRQYGVSVGFAEPKEFDMKVFKGTVRLNTNTKINIEYSQEKGFSLVAELHGDFEIKKVNVFGKKLEMPAVGFEKLIVKSQKKYLYSAGNWNVPDSLSGSFMGFGYNVGFFEIIETDGNAEMKVHCDFNISAGDGINISAASAFRILGEVKENPDDGKVKYKWKTIKVDMLEIEADLAAVYFYGSIIFFKNDSIFGTGFQGRMELYIKGMSDTGGTGIAAMGIFGTDINEQGKSYRYFLVDVLLKSETGITIPSTGLKLNGIGGGVYYRMDQQSVTQTITASAEITDPYPSVPKDAYEAAIRAKLGRSLSGTVYLPDDKVSFGINATVVLSLEGEPKTMNANITLTAQLNENFGISFLRLKGVLNFMSPISWTGPSCNGLSAAVEMELVFPGAYKKPGFYANAHIFARVEEEGELIFYGGNNIDDAPEEYVSAMTQNGCNEEQIKYAGGMEMQFTKNSFWIYLGKPTKRLTAIADLKVAKPAISAYLDLGTKVPAFPGLPPEFGPDFAVAIPSENVRSNGAGFAFGASLGINFNASYFSLSASLKAKAGYDMMLKKYNDTYCQNGQPLGIEYFYASGQMYFFAEAKLKFEGLAFASGSLKAALQFRGPKPFYTKAQIIAKGKIAGLEAKKTLKFEYGEICEPSSDDDEYILVSSIFPSENLQNIEVGSDILGIMNFPLFESFYDIDINGVESECKLKIDDFYVSKGNDQVPGKVKYGYSSISLNPHEWLDYETEYTVNLNATFTNVTSGKIEKTEKHSIKFTTGVEPDHIPESNIVYSSPQNSQFAYYLNGNNIDPVIKLERDQGYLFDNDTMEYKAIFTSSFPGFYGESDITYDSQEYSIHFNLPQNLDQIKGNAIKIDFIERPIGESPMYENIQGEILEINDLPIIDYHIIYTMVFRTSLYSTIEDKFSDAEIIEMIGKKSKVTKLKEAFGKEELIGMHGKEASINLEIDLENTPFYMDNYDYYDNYYQPIQLYKGGSGIDQYHTIAIKDRLSDDRIDKYGTKEPITAIELIQDNTNQMVANESNFQQINFKNQNSEPYKAIDVRLSYDLKDVVWGDIKGFLETTMLYDSKMQSALIDIMIHASEICNIDDDDIEDPALSYDCCVSNTDFRDAITAIYTSYLADEVVPDDGVSNNFIFGRGHYVVNSIESCQNIYRTGVIHDGHGFLNHEFKEIHLGKGTYPIKIIYKNPFNVDDPVFIPIELERNYNHGDPLPNTSNNEGLNGGE